jgi:transcriptional regulator with XRE-family HTH domain
MTQSTEAFYKGLGLRLRMTRAVLGLTEEQMADIFGLSLRAYRRHEAGAGRGMRGGGIAGSRTLAMKYHVNLDWLLSHEDTRREFLR